MGEDSYGYIGSLLFWLFLPPFLAQFILGMYYGMVYRNKSQRPQKGSKMYSKHYRIAYATVVICYFSYCMIDFVHNLGPSYYDIIGVQRVETDEKLKSHFKHTIISLHPDKNPNGDTAKFMQLKQIYEVLNNEPTRVAYDCYGPDIIRTVNTSSAKSGVRSSIGEYFMQSLYEWIGFYVGTLVFFVISMVLGSRSGIFWRGMGLVVVAMIDLYVITRPISFGISRNIDLPFRSLPVIGGIIRWLMNIPTHYKVAIMKRAYIYSSTGFGQVLGLHKETSPEVQIDVLSGKIDTLAKLAMNRESDFQLVSTMDPVAKNESMRELLRQKMGKIAAELQLFDSLSAADRRRLINRKGT